MVHLPSSWGTESPRGETAYRDLRDLVWQIGRHAPNVALPVVERLLGKQVTAPSHNDLRSLHADLRHKAAMTSTRPRSAAIAASLDSGPPASVEQLRALMLELMMELQKDIQAGDSNMIDQIYNGNGRLDEVNAMFRVSAWLKPHGYLSARALQAAIASALPDELRGRLDVFVLDVSRGGT